MKMKVHSFKVVCVQSIVQTRIIWKVVHPGLSQRGDTVNMQSYVTRASQRVHAVGTKYVTPASRMFVCARGLFSFLVS